MLYFIWYANQKKTMFHWLKMLMIWEHLKNHNVIKFHNIENEAEKRLEVDYDHYKSVVIEPIGRLLCNINDKIYDQLVDIL